MPSDLNAKIRDEAMNKSQIMRTLHFLSDVYGPRLTGSPNHKAAAIGRSNKCRRGVSTTRVSSVGFRSSRLGQRRAAGFITAPVQDSARFEVLAWTPGTKGACRSGFQLIIRLSNQRTTRGF
jgi:hypothetical protein